MAGYETCRALALNGANVVMAVRNTIAGEEAKAEIVRERVRVAHCICM
jgi:NAD(P)-dependent dehydrogenase (short-subunit alcohol dehydrogenase family)